MKEQKRLRKLPRSVRRRIARTARHVQSRRMFILQGVALLGSGGAIASRISGGVAPQAGRADLAPVRPPTASQDDAVFQDRCIRCGLCGTVCENGCIRYFALHQTMHGALTPYLDVRRRSCTLCMRCTQICPTDALRPVEDDLDSIKATVRMGLATVDPDRCISYQGRICGYCHDACPFPGEAIRLVSQGRPQVLDGCVGCGRCVEQCPQYPTAIDVATNGKRPAVIEQGTTLPLSQTQDQEAT